MTTRWWRYPSGTVRQRIIPGYVDLVAAVVVIDPENREQVEQLAEGYVSQFYDGRNGSTAQHTTAMQTALREFTDPTPPKPAEPTGLGAVVEDINGVRWVRTLDEPECWIDARIQGDWSTYADFEAVKVLSEGVSA